MQKLIYFILKIIIIKKNLWLIGTDKMQNSYNKINSMACEKSLCSMNFCVSIKLIKFQARALGEI